MVFFTSKPFWSFFHGEFYPLHILAFLQNHDVNTGSKAAAIEGYISAENSVGGNVMILDQRTFDIEDPQFDILIKVIHAHPEAVFPHGIGEHKGGEILGWRRLIIRQARPKTSVPLVSESIPKDAKFKHTLSLSVNERLT